ncbi:LysR family transcriptional regulator [Pseudoflavonifractor sp. 524-17]|uniref:LysR family transcriptional regulator n=1 Tax=Pseudoflavonifractor sp. 524-17 TaxID=2304577 RepID=UPI00137A3B97|nr:LysR family transcriptional regulator [Pseudoflavonifractor sp. 524-17]NCE63405.1 LysR family transcriptional regulator [Pseudoflavonifractor sp. 524-17]
MDIRVLQYFLAVAREESITKAAEALRMTLPPLSRQLKELEEELGKTLLIRGSKKVTLTEDGVLLRKRAQELVELMEKTKAELSSSGETINGDVYIGSGETDAISFFAQAAGKLQKKYPLIHYHMYSGDAEIIMEKLDKGLIDFGLLVGPVDVSKYDYMRLPVSDTWGVLMRRDSPLARHETIHPEDLWDKPLIVSQQTYVSRDIFAWLGNGIQRLNVVLTYNLIYNASRFVKDGFGYAITLDKLINTTGDSALCFRPLSPRLEAGLCIVWKKYQIFSRASKAFLHQLKQEWDSDGSAQAELPLPKGCGLTSKKYPVWEA